jgi:hypothetical protein
LAASGVAAGQTPSEVAPPALLGKNAAVALVEQAAPAAAPAPAVVTSVPATPVLESGTTGPAIPRVWASTDYLAWWIRPAQLTAPLVTVNPNPATIAALNEPGTRILAGGRDVGLGTFSGMRATLGGWLDDEASLGLEVSGFLLEQNSSHFSASVPGGGSVLAIPNFSPVPFNGAPAGETSLNSGGGPMSVTTRYASRLWGSEINALSNLYTNDTSRLDLIGGFRYLDLEESLRLRALFPAGPGASVLTQDAFGTRNQFYGGQLGARWAAVAGKLNFAATAKVALGSTHEVLNVLGSNTVTGGAFGFNNGTYLGGIFAEPSNRGRFSQDRLTVLPTLQGRLGYDILSNLRAYVGYDFLYANDFVRPGNQVSHIVNPTQNQLFGNPGGQLVGPAEPAPAFNHSDFWAHGVSFGVELRF